MLRDDPSPSDNTDSTPLAAGGRRRLSSGGMTALYRHGYPIFLLAVGVAIVGPNVATDLAGSRLRLMTAVQIILLIGGVVWAYSRGRTCKEVWLNGEVLEVSPGAHVVRVPLTAVHWVELMNTQVWPSLIRLRVDPAAGAGNKISFVPVGSNITGGGGEIATELRQLVRGTSQTTG
jgi:hypothetical protein